MKIKKTRQRAGLCFSNHEDGIWPMNATKSICSLDNTAEDPISPQPHTATWLHFHKTRKGRTKSFSKNFRQKIVSVLRLWFDCSAFVKIDSFLKYHFVHVLAWKNLWVLSADQAAPQQLTRLLNKLPWCKRIKLICYLTFYQKGTYLLKFCKYTFLRV